MRGRTHVRGTNRGMNRLEKSWADNLKLQQFGGSVHSFMYEACKLRLADNTYYTPDFRVVTPDGHIEMHEVKGFWEDDARVKFKVASELHPYRFVAITHDKTGWHKETWEHGQKVADGN